HLPYPLYHGYLQLTSQDPPADPALRTVPPRRENTWMNAGYAAQWWIFATLVLIGFGWLARRHGRGAGGRGGAAPGGATGGRPPLRPARPAAGWSRTRFPGFTRTRSPGFTSRPRPRCREHHRCHDRRPHRRHDRHPRW